MEPASLGVTAANWLRYSERDLEAAQSLRRFDGPSPRHAGWLAGQAAEKALKAALASAGLEPLDTHDLEALRRGLPDDWPATLRLPNLERLSAWFPLAVYPGEWAIVTDPGAAEMVDLAAAVVAAVREDLGNLVAP